MSKPASKQYTRQQKAALIAEVKRRHAAGEGTIHAISEHLGISKANYYNWLSACAEAEPSPAMRPVEVMALVPAKPAPPKLSLNAPGGYRVEGLDIESAAALLKALT